MKTILFLFIFLFAAISLAAAPKEYWLIGQVANSFTHEQIPYVDVTLMRPDSSVVATTQTRKTSRGGRLECPFLFFLKFEEQGKFILRFTHPEYNTLHTDIEVKLRNRQHSYNMDIIFLDRIREITLQEVTVTASKVKMVMRGDTVVYNADAFRLAEGSMLDALIKQLPGAELKSDGRIYVNGRFVNSLLLNGKDFMKGNNRVLLDNLPYYMVDKVKAYEQTADMGRFEGKQAFPKLFVMDVNLKKEYSIGWIANAEAGYGSGNRFLGRLFGLRFTDNSRLTVFGNSNNINDTRRPGESGDWNPSQVFSGQQTSHIAGVDYRLDDKYRKYKFKHSTQVERYKTDLSIHGSGVTFVPAGDVFSRSQYLSDNRDFKISTSNNLTLTWKKVYWQTDARLDLSKNSNNMLSRTGTFSSAPVANISIAALMDSLFFSSDKSWTTNATNRVFNQAIGRNRNTNAVLNSTFTYRPWQELSDAMHILLNTSYNRSDNTVFDHYVVDYLALNPVQTDFRNRHTLSPERKFNIASSLGYYYWLDNGIALVPTYKFNHSYISGDKSRYRLDRLAGWESKDARPLGDLPSTRDSLSMAMDIQNSFYSTSYKNVHEGGLSIDGETNFLGGRLQVSAFLPLHIENNTLKYKRNLLDTTLVRPLVSFAPSLWLEARSKDFRRTTSLHFGSSVNVPQMTYLLDIVDDTQPLNVFHGNPGLKNSTTHYLLLRYSATKTEIEQTFSINYGLNIVQNAVALGFVYNKQNGVRTTTPQNVSGNWQNDLRILFGRAVDKMKRWSFNTDTYFGYNHNVDLIGVSDGMQMQRNAVHNYNIKEDVSVRFRHKWFQASGKFGFNATSLRGERKDFVPINYREYNYGADAIIDLPLKLQLSTDITQYSRRGFSEQTMNTDDLVWNIRLSKSILQGNLIFMLDAFDVLGNLSNVYKSINAQGRTDSYYNVMPRYVLFHTVYRLNVKPKNKR